MTALERMRVPARCGHCEKLRSNIKRGAVWYSCAERKRDFDPWTDNAWAEVCQGPQRAGKRGRVNEAPR